MRSHVDPDATEGCQTGSPQVASNLVYGIISGASYEYQRLNSTTSTVNIRIQTLGLGGTFLHKIIQFFQTMTHVDILA